MNPLRSDLIKGYEETIARCRQALSYGCNIKINLRRIEEAQKKIEILKGNPGEEWLE